MSMRQWINPGEWIKSAVAIATVVVAVFSILIERQLVAQEKERAAVQRSIALYQDLVESDAVRHLLKVDHTIDHALWLKYGSDMTPEETKKGAISIYNEEPLYLERKKILQSVAELLQSIDIIYDCGNYRKIYESDHNQFGEDEGENENFCDRKTISILLGGIMTEIFFAIRPVLYCDDFITNYYFRESNETNESPDEPNESPDKYSSSYIGRFESLIEDHLRNTHGKYRVFRTEAKKEHKKYDGIDYSIVRMPQEGRCEHYNSS